MNVKLNASRSDASPSGWFPALMVSVGAFQLLMQVLLLREFLVVFFGNELTIGAVFSVWLVLIGAGSLLATRLVARWPEERLRFLLAALLALAAVLLPLQIGMIRIVRTALQVSYGEYVPFASMLASLFVILAPGCLINGMAFPSVCRLALRRSSYAVSRVYAMEALGSMVAGAFFSFWLVWLMRPFAVAALAGVLVLAGTAWLVVKGRLRLLFGFAALVFAGLAFYPACLAPLERASVEARWRSFGALPPSGSSFAGSARLVASCDSRYQNLAVIETEGQMTLYANGQVMAVFPDAVGSEHKIHFVMAQKPDARRVLLIGGNPANDIPELLKYPLEQLVYLELDARVGRLLESLAPSAYRQALRDPRLVRVNMDAPRYVKQYGRGGLNGPGAATGRRDSNAPLFDAVLVDASEPATIALNRFYTQEFYSDIRAVLAPDGFLHTAVAVSEQLQGETAYLSASICLALRAVFDRVLVTAGTQNHFFAGAANCSITLARDDLFRRSAGAKIKNRYFRPEYFLNADEISPEKIDFVEQRLASIPVTANTVLKPVSTFYQIALWNRFSGSGLEALVERLIRFGSANARPVSLRLGWVFGGLLGFGVICLGIGTLLGRRTGFAPAVTGNPAGEPAVRATVIFSRSMLILVIAASGFCGMSLELILIFAFQALLGYVYSKVGLIVAVFMLGLAFGALVAPRILKRNRRLHWRAMAAMEIILIAEAAVIPWLLSALSAGLMNWISWGWVEALIYGLIALIAAAVGAEFALVNEIMSSRGVTPIAPDRALHSGAPPDSGATPDNQSRVKGRTAALTDASDHLGAALGGLVIGVLLLPLFGITATCLLLAAVKLASLLGLLAARRAMPA